MELNADTLERLVPDELHPEDQAAAATLRLHVERYEFAAEHARGQRLLDIACGVGYGTRILADRRADAADVVGVDLSESVVRYAEERYGDDRVRYVCSDAMRFEDERGFDTVVSLETVEHVPDPVALFERLVGLVRSGGVLISSVPTTPSADLNPHHLHDFTEARFREMGAVHRLTEIASLGQEQRVPLAELFRGSRFKRGNLRPNLPAYYLANPSAFARRVVATLRFGLTHHYLTVVWQRPA